MSLNCWDFKKCERQPGGMLAEELGICPAALNMEFEGTNSGDCGGRICWRVAGTLCGGKVQGEFAQKLITCTTCDFYSYVKREEGDQFYP